MEPEVQVDVYLEKVRFRVGMYFTQHYTANSLKDVETPQAELGPLICYYVVIAFLHTVPIVQMWRLRP